MRAQILINRLGMPYHHDKRDSMRLYSLTILGVLLLTGLVWGAIEAIKPVLHASHSAAGTASNSLHQMRSTLAQPVIGQTGGPTTARIRLGIWPQVITLAPGDEPIVPPADELLGDFDGDNAVGFNDFFLFSDAFGQDVTTDNAFFDLDGDKVIGFGDFFIFADMFGQRLGGEQ